MCHIQTPPPCSSARIVARGLSAAVRCVPVVPSRLGVLAWATTSKVAASSTKVDCVDSGSGAFGVIIPKALVPWAVYRILAESACACARESLG